MGPKSTDVEDLTQTGLKARIAAVKKYAVAQEEMRRGKLEGVAPSRKMHRPVSAAEVATVALENAHTKRRTPDEHFYLLTVNQEETIIEV